ncbi:hypothetical protein ISF6_5122 [Piscinibacter sakaiensis]|uniref:Uncharacterized protein n=1 Tax=Piscinibacter sakaiensis TaxID=1547922 RepID=A0A0K8NWA9_PISS1|nr:hypothetical protein ISF6_5122 [Piscinibacter sakaiensis]
MERDRTRPGPRDGGSPNCSRPAAGRRADPRELECPRPRPSAVPCSRPVDGAGNSFNDATRRTP